MSEGPGRGGMRISDPRVMRALAHPARIEIVDYLNNTGAVVTATECASMVGLTPSATSYHLRELAKIGLVEQAPSRGDGRERVWRSAGTGLTIQGDPAEPDVREAERAVVEAYLTQGYQRLKDFAGRSGDESPPWREASTLTSMQLLLTAEEMTVVNQQVRALLEPYRMRVRQESPPEGARKVQVQWAAFPEP